ncbi:MAG: hypothetical protein NXI31_00880 [bacterium]|nr:hypothetical protein [bacterium]
MTPTGEGKPRLTEKGWIRKRWLAEKIVSGELPAAVDDMLKKCDGVFVENEDLEEHVKLMTAFFTGHSGEELTDTDRRLSRLRAYLERLLSVREMWARERC